MRSRHAPLATKSLTAQSAETAETAQSADSAHSAHSASRGARPAPVAGQPGKPGKPGKERAKPAGPPAPRGAAAAIPERAGPADETPPIVSHPDGWYWIAPDGHQQFGPFETYEHARADRDAWDEEAPTPGATLQEAEEEIGIASWIDPQTGEPAEGTSPPHLDAEDR
jgi:hypothetical protein